MWSAPAERSRDGAFLQPRRSRLGQELAILFLIAPFMGGADCPKPNSKTS